MSKVSANHILLNLYTEECLWFAILTFRYRPDTIKPYSSCMAHVYIMHPGNVLKENWWAYLSEPFTHAALHRYTLMKSYTILAKETFIYSSSQCRHMISKTDCVLLWTKFRHIQYLALFQSFIHTQESIISLKLHSPKHRHQIFVLGSSSIQFLNLSNKN